MPPASEMQALLVEDRWIRALAMRLVGERSSADDLVQEAYLTALAGDARPRSARGWLGGVVRNLWRDRARAGKRRARRERVAARAEALPSSAELVAEVELRRRVAEAVLTLDEPLRRTVVLRFFQERSLESIAAAEGVSVSTVHERVQRALARLRVELDRAHDGRREAWAGTLISLARRASRGAGTIGGAVMASAWKVAAGAACILGGLAWWWSGNGRAAERAEHAAPARTELALAEHEGAAPLLALPTTDAAREASAGSAAPAQQLAASAPEFLGRVIDTTGAGIAGVEVERASAHGEAQRATSAADGSFALASDREDLYRDQEVRCLDPRYTTLVAAQGFFNSQHLVIVSPARSFAGTVVDASSTPIEGAELVFGVRPELFATLGIQLPRVDDPAGWHARTDVSGSFALPDLAGGPHFELRVRALGFRERRFELPAQDDPALVLTLEREADTLELAGIVLGPDGRPFAGARVSAGHEMVESGADGGFRLVCKPSLGSWSRDESGDWRLQPGDHLRLIALAQGRAPAHAEFERDAVPSPLVLQLGATPLAISGWVLDPEGQPLAGVVVWPPRLTPFGVERRAVTDDWVYVEEEICGQQGGWFGTLTGADGAFELGCLIEGPIDLALFDAHTAARTTQRIDAGSRDVELVFAREPDTMHVAGRVLWSDGSPVSGVMIRPRRTERYNDNPPQLVGGEYWRTTDAQGRFDFAALATRGTRLAVEGLPFTSALALADVADLEHIEIVRPRLCELQVIVGPASPADAFALLDEHGAELHLIEIIQNGHNSIGFTDDPRAELRSGRSGVVQAPETARTLVLFQGEQELRRVPVTLDPAQRTELHP